MGYRFKGYLGSLQNAETYRLNSLYTVGLEKGLERITEKETTEKEGGIVGRLFSGRAKTLKATIKALISDIQLRERLNEFLLYSIDRDMSKEKSLLSHLQSLNAHYSPELAERVNTRKRQLEESILELEKEKRKEYLECWRDIMFMKKYLLSALREYWDLNKKSTILGNGLSALLKDKGTFEPSLSPFPPNSLATLFNYRKNENPQRS